MSLTTACGVPAAAHISVNADSDDSPRVDITVLLSDPATARAAQELALRLAEAEAQPVAALPAPQDPALEFTRKKPDGHWEK